MPIAAVPSYLGQDFSQASPGLRFGMYLKLWGVNRRTQKLLWGQQDIGYEVRGQERREREIHYDNKTPAIREACTLKGRDKDTLHALLARQRAAFTARAGSEGGLCIEAIAVAPFTTGLGNEHPLENGFAFLNPYGLPYLPGSGVKGVLRQAARELASGEWGDTHGWSSQTCYAIEIGSGKDKRPIALSMLDVLFGRETDSGDTDHVRGALSFWDVIPQIKGDSLAVDIMTPHQGHYYQQKAAPRTDNSTTPHDSGQPNPISLLTVPPGSGFVFHVLCDMAHLTRLAPELAEAGHDGKARWQTLIEAAFAHAFQWLGFGAKTAVGYGAMKPPTPTASATQHAADQPVLSQAEASSSATETIWMEAKLTFDPGSSEIKAHYQGKTTAGLKRDAAQKLIESLGERAAKLKKAKELKNVRVRVRIEGNLIELLGLANDP
jgi:CRISPR-associated protein Cmr6